MPTTVLTAPTRNAISKDPASLITRLMSESKRNKGTASGTRIRFINPSERVGDTFVSTVNSEHHTIKQTHQDQNLQAGEVNGITPTFAKHNDINIVTSGALSAFPKVVFCSIAIPHPEINSRVDKMKLVSPCNDDRMRPKDGAADMCSDVAVFGDGGYRWVGNDVRLRTPP